MKPAPFAYYRAHSAAEAVDLLASATEAGDDAKLLAGGLSLVPLMNVRLARPDVLADVSRLDGLRYITAGHDERVLAP